MQYESDIQVDDLPHSLRRLVGLIGIAAATRLVQAYGGSRLYVPQHATLVENWEHPLVKLMGEKSALGLAHEHGGTTIEIPMARAAVRMARDRGLLADRAAGASIRDLARKYHMHERSVYQVLERGRQEAERAAGQLLLFG